jgi:MFS family permease
LSKSQTPEQPHDVELDIRRLFKLSHTGTIGCLAVGIANGAFWSLAPLFTAGVSNDPSLAAWFMSATVVGGAAGQWPLGYLSDKIGRRKTLLLSTVSCAIVAAFILMLGGRMGFVGINALGGAWGFFAFPMYTIAVAHANDYAEADDYVMVSSGLLLMFGIGAIAGPFVAAAVMVLSGTSGLYLMTLLVHASLAGYVLLRIFRRSSAPTEHHIAFGDALATAHTASQVYEEEIQYQEELEEQD